ncbi:MAG TPA: HD domain-containing phosphohydrolase [Spirochaetota bacterium]|jgi:HD-GYP domain-containing protein (c-di-GMP phosphodiesterase class II)|nr:MAG: Cyclic di-GMP phosphodiesterase response regulator RpfG [Spirochaetes bacterium ADurb.Bin133]HOF00822.1 HD domain-containing phosphohydrolase [Spirochaetota bacterium]HOS32547.1 HD domain-containing phosphohydrolase [Spirochaetota bacterium]HOS55995.1 HD domain-containing phosphohydrolase [Spirochaetota bacterium]HPK61105.1 HD domain-containing phosphohydrolase [Spirochaetota bacterium]
MSVIYYSGADDQVKSDLKKILSVNHIFEDFTTYSNLEEHSALIVNFTKLKDLKWEKFWPSKLPAPKGLLMNNVHSIGIVEHNFPSLAMKLLDDGFSDFFQYPFYEPRVIGALMNTARDIEYEKELSSLYQIGIDLSSQSDLEILLQKILKTSLDFTNSDGGSIYLVLKEINSETGEKMMQFERSMSDTLGERYQKVKMPINNKSLAGYVINTGKSLNILDAYKIPKSLPYKFNSSFDKKNNYRSKTMIVVPMINHNGEIIGAIQLINKKKNRSIKLIGEDTVKKNVVEFDHKSELLIRSLGSQATIAIENARLYQEIQALFESFMEASVSAVESRDPSTAGHSRRVSKLSVAMANLINFTDNGPLKNVKFSQDDIRALNYAGLLHDFGKIGIPEKILLKDKKLHIEEILGIEGRMETLKYHLFLNGNKAKKNSEIDKLVNEIISNVDDLKNAILSANEPGFITEEVADKLKKAKETDVVYLDKKTSSALSDEEYNRLLHSRGSLSSEEYEIMKSHVDFSYKFLNLIVWPKGLEKVPEIARAHHEKLDGSGYPQGLKGSQIPLESQIMSIVDIFDALTSSDRPYKNRISVDKALDILKKEAADKKINKDILDLMIESLIYEIILEK